MKIKTNEESSTVNRETRNLWLKRADENLPRLIETEIVPDCSCDILKKGDELILDMNTHYVGYLSFNVDYVDVYLDAPVRLYIKFCETERELEDDFSQYNGTLCASWLQQEYVHIDFPGIYKMPRRYAARFIKIRVAETPRKLRLSDFKFRAVSSAEVKNLKKFDIQDEQLGKIDTVAVNTLKNCMHRVFEDGPKRDRRLWIGDLRLEALTNYYTFDNRQLVRRCLYLFAAADTNESGFIPGYVYENPRYISGNWFLVDYAFLFVACVCDYYVHTGDKETFDILYAATKSQMDAGHRILDENGIITATRDNSVFIDWCKELNKTTALHGVYLYVLELYVNALEQAGYAEAAIYRERLEQGRESARTVLYNPEKKMFINARDDYQYSVHSAVWMILGGVVSGETAENILLNALNAPESLKPFTPYMHHYVVEALIKLHMPEEAISYIKRYWGGMVELGADTFYEVYVPDDTEFSPYRDRMINSMCHAWSCTPSYFIRKYSDLYNL